LGHIFYIEDKQNYYLNLGGVLSSYNVDYNKKYNFDAFPKELNLPLTVVDLKTMKRETQLANIKIIDKNRVIFYIHPFDPESQSIYSFDPVNGDYSSLADKSGKEYAVLYFPRINIENDKVFININYKIGENFKGKGEQGVYIWKEVSSADKTKAYENYKNAYKKEEDYEKEYQELIKKDIDIQRIKSKKQKIFSLSELPSLSSEWIKTAKVPEDEKEFSQIIDYLNAAQKTITPIDFFNMVLEINNYDVFKSLTMSYNFLNKERSSLDSYNLQIFSESPGDNSGAWIHFFADALMAYTSQGIVSELDNNDDILQLELKKFENYSLEEVIRDSKLREYHTVTGENILPLTYIQLKFIEKGSSYFGDMKEIYTLVTIFREEVAHFPDLSGEVLVDFRGSAFGRMLYSDINNKRLVSGTYYGFSIRDNIVDTFLPLASGLTEKVPWYIKALLDVAGLEDKGTVNNEPNNQDE